MGGQGAAQEPTGEQGGEGKEECGLLGRHKAAQEPTEVGEVGSLLDRMRERRKERERKEKEEEEERIANKKKKKIKGGKKGKKEVPETKKEENPPMLKNWLRRKYEEKNDFTVDMTVENSRVEVETVENVRKSSHFAPDVEYTAIWLLKSIGLIISHHSGKF